MAYSMHKQLAQRQLHSCAVAAISAALIMVVICTIPDHVVQARQLQLDPFAARNGAAQVAIHDEFSSGSQPLPRSEQIQQHGSEEHVGISSLTIQESSGMEQAIVSMNWDLQSADVSHDRALLHDLGCLKARCMAKCRRCTVAIGAKLGHCRGEGKRFDCTARRVNWPGENVTDAETLESKEDMPPEPLPGTESLPTMEGTVTGGISFSVLEDSRPWKRLSGMPVVASFRTTRLGQEFCLSAGTSNPQDARNDFSVYAHMHEDCDLRTTFKLIPQWEDTFKVQVVENRGATMVSRDGKDWYLAAHSTYLEDSVAEDQTRVMMALGVDYGSKWRVLEHESGGILQLAYNDYGPSTGIVGQYLRFSTPRDDESAYLSVSPSMEDAIHLTISGE